MNGEPIRTVAPTALAVSLAELSAHLRLDGIDGQEAYLAGLVRVSTEHVEQYTGLGLITQTWTQTFSAWPTSKQPGLTLWRRPLQDVASVEFLASEGSPSGLSSVLDPSVYRVIGVGGAKVAGNVRLATGATWPVLYDDPEAITVTYRVGFGDDHNAVPELIRHAIMQFASTLYGVREDVAMGSTVAELPFASKALLRDWRPLAIA